MRKPSRYKPKPPVPPSPRAGGMEELAGKTMEELLTLVGVADNPVLPGFEMADEPIPTPLARAVEKQRSYSDEINQRAASGQTFTEFRDGAPMPEPDPIPVGRQEILPPSRTGDVPRYQSRIRVLDAWQYPGTVTSAPVYVDRNWVGWGDRDALRKIDPGPVLRVPLTPHPDERTIVVCRVGDYVVHEEIMGDDGGLEERVEVWEQDQFRRLFLPASGPSG